MVLRLSTRSLEQSRRSQAGGGRNNLSLNDNLAVAFQIEGLMTALSISRVVEVMQKQQQSYAYIRPRCPTLMP